MDQLQRFRGRIRKCALCQAEVVFAMTVTTERRRGGNWMMLDALPNAEGNVAVRDNGRILLARPLAKDETHDKTTEDLAMPHQATCGIRELADEAEAYLRGITEEAP